MSEQRDPPARHAAFDPVEIDDLLDTGGGLFGELMDNAVEQWEDIETGRWLGTEVGPYRITDYLDRGGMSLVFRAERCDGQYEQQVAVKVLHTANGAELAKRFALERQLLARLEHPGIARIIDSGVVDGQPWIVMELVDGEAVDVYCDRHRLGIDARLDLFVQVARAVQFAHGRLIVHRDLKPGNILVNADGQSKLLDFGIAKALQGDSSPQLTGATMLLTPQYASPEQVLGEPVGVASDIYQLGLLLYRLLTGCNAQTIDTVSVANIKSVVIDEEPLSPSLRVEATGEQDIERAEQLALARSTSIAKLRKTLDGDLDIIVNECLNKDPAERYLTVQSMIEDISSYRKLSPIQARTPSALYRTERFVRRHRGGVLTGLLVLLILIGSLVFSTWSWRRTLIAEQQALQQAETADTVADFLSDMLSLADPRDTAGEDPTVSELLNRSQERLDEFTTTPLVRAKLELTMSEAYFALRRLDTAKMLAESAATTYADRSQPRGLSRTLDVLTEIYMVEGNIDQAVTTARRSLAVVRQFDGPSLEHAYAQGTLAAALSDQGRYDEAYEFATVSLAGMANGQGQEVEYNRAIILTTMGTIARQQGEYELAGQHYEQGLSVTSGRQELLAQEGLLLYQYGVLDMQLDQHEQAEPKLQRGLAAMQQVYGDSHEALLGPQLFLARTQLALGRLPEAEGGFARSLELVEEFLGKEHANYAMVLFYTTELEEKRGDLDKAASTLRTATEIVTTALGSDHPYLIQFRLRRAELTMLQGQPDAALQELHPLRDEGAEVFGAEHPTVKKIDLAIEEAVRRLAE